MSYFEHLFRWLFHAGDDGRSFANPCKSPLGKRTQKRRNKGRR